MSESDNRLAFLRESMVEGLMSAHGIHDVRVLAAMREVPRHLFIPPELEESAYEDVPLPIGESQTISQPYIVALMLQALELKPGDRVLETGTGSGYAAALLGRLAGDVYSIERIESLAHTAALRLRELGHSNVHVHHADGSLGWPDASPYDAVVVAAGSPAVPRTLLEQLKEGGRLVMPVGDKEGQVLIRVRREGNRFNREELETVRFVPLIGQGGWSDNPSHSPCGGQGSLYRSVAGLFSAGSSRKSAASSVLVSTPKPSLFPFATNSVPNGPLIETSSDQTLF